jgi:hypothetical protein
MTGGTTTLGSRQTLMLESLVLFYGAVVIKYSLEALNFLCYRYATFTLIHYFQNSWKLQPRVLKTIKMIKLHIFKSREVS